MIVSLGDLPSKKLGFDRYCRAGEGEVGAEDRNMAGGTSDLGDRGIGGGERGAQNSTELSESLISALADK